jgi:NAD(P)-dependent dehydrogenase (short-subunit alcohol dehydrogenase family)
VVEPPVVSIGLRMTDPARLDVLFGLSDRVAIVTGGSRGIGRAIAEAFARAGARVVIASRKADACEAAAHAIRRSGGDALAVPTHMANLDALRVLVDATVDAFGGVDIVVNNAANALALPISEITPEAWEKSLAVNLRGPLFLVQYALPHLAKSPHASVINVLSAGVYLRSEGRGLYAAGKAGLLALTRTMAGELAPLGIRVNALAPGTVDTDMVRNNDPEAQERMRSASPMGRMASAEEMAGPALLLAGDGGSYMTGQVVSVDGGLAVH